MVSFIFGGNTNETPESLKRKREMIEMLMMGQSPKNVGEGVGALMKGFTAGVLRHRADKAETAGRESGNSMYNSIVSMLTGNPSGAGQSAGGGNIPMSGAGAELSATTPGATPDMTGNEVYSGFMDTVKAGGVNNPYGLAAIAATGNAESRFSPGNVNRTWSDPSERGQAGTAGGVMSWRGPRLASLQAYAASKGEQGNGSPQTQAEFLLQEDPQLIARLNGAQSVDEAQSLMNNAWKFAGYNRQGGEAGRRRASARSYLPSFQGGGETAALTAADAIEAVSPLNDGNMPTGGEAMPDQGQQFDVGRFGVSDLSGAPIVGRQGLASALQAGEGGQQTQSLPVESMPTLDAQAQAYGAMGQSGAGQQAIGAQTGGQAMPAQEVAQAQGIGQSQTMQGQGMSGPSLQQLYEAAANPWLSPEQKSVVNMLIDQEMRKQQSVQAEQQWRGRQDYEQQLKQRDPSYQLEQDYRRAQIGKMNREAETGGETFFGNPVAVQNQDGSISYGQIGNKGTFRPIKLGEGQSFAPPTKTVDTGTETILMDQAGNVISRTAKQNRQEAFDKAGGAAEGKTQAETKAEYDSITSKMPGLYGVVDRLETLADDATYTMAGKGYDWARNQLGLDPRDGAVARAEYTAVVDNQILPLLRDTFGAQFTQEEGQRLARTLGDPDKSPVEKQALLRAFIQQKERDIQGLASRLGGTHGGQRRVETGGRSPVSIGGYTIEEVD